MTNPPRFGDRVRVRSGATGRYLRDGLALVVSAQDNDLFIDHVDAHGDPPHPRLPVPSDVELAAAAATLRYSRSTTHADPPTPPDAPVLVAESPRYRVVTPDGVMKGIPLDNARRIAADLGGRVEQSMVRLYRGGKEELDGWTPADTGR